MPAAVAARILCDGHVQVAALDPDGHVLELGRAARLFSAAQRRAIALRDGACRGPGCSAPPAWCEAHHVQSWQAGGATDVANGLLLCTRCHHEVHSGRLRVSRQGSGWRVHRALAPPPRRHLAREPLAV
ncbi:HNH endonuclease signature motif containing protein [Agrococcus sp. SL85]|uniref:HNH endonuclease signature motif containing protein n=1 Tax=Agrococcus sp. SL85 TaxID=2995141 RepID=UPI00226C973B|nr:HNH endonuclease signature motif containing protein [Agrococcus sp. SL85]WAC66016.1 HNH endonuclease signature motif containing protein [Agrococcus sp. SL85]